MYIKGRMMQENSKAVSSSRIGETVEQSAPRGLRIGSTLQGKVIAMHENEIELLLKGDIKIIARLEQSMKVTLNQVLNFEVKRTNNALVLRPLFENLGQDKFLMKALHDANMPINEANIEMVETLMQKGMPINKETLNELNRQVSLFPNANGKDLIEMKEMGIAITENNVTQFLSYKGMNHYLVDAFYGMANTLQDSLLEMAQDGNDEGIQMTLHKFNLLISEKFSNEYGEETTKKMANSLSSIENKDGNINNKANEMGKDIVLKSNESVLLQEKEGEEKKGKDDIKQYFKSSIRTKTNATVIRNYIEKVILVNNNMEKNIVKDISLQKVFQLLEDTAKSENTSVLFKELFHFDEFKNGIQELLEEKCLLEPKEFIEKDVVKESFTRMKQEVMALQQLSEEMGKSGEELHISTNSFQNNLEFMNQLNQLFDYMQLPLKQDGNRKTGELFVYAKKKSGEENGTNVSAILHLNMKNIGALDIHVKIEEQNVDTRFFIEDENSYDFISSHLSEFNEAIQKRGYVGYSAVEILKEEKSTFDYLKERQELEGNYMISNQSFDARA